MTLDVYTAVGELVRVQRLTIHVTAEVSYTAKAACRLAQLADAVAASSNGSGGHSKPGSRIPIAADPLDLYRDIACAVGLWAYALQVDRSGLTQGAPTGAGINRARFETPPLGRLLRKVAGEAIRLNRHAMASRIAGDARHWAARIDTMLPQPRLRPDGSMVGQPESSSIRGRACPNCGAVDVPETRPSDDPDEPPETYRVPALQHGLADADHGQAMPFWWCRAVGCGHWGWLEMSEIEHREAS